MNPTPPFSILAQNGQRYSGSGSGGAALGLRLYPNTPREEQGNMETPGHPRHICLCSTQTCLAQTLPRFEFWCPQVFPTCSRSMFSLCSGYVWSSGFCSGLPLSNIPSFLVRIPRISVSNAAFRAFESCLLHPGLDSMGFPGVLLSLIFFRKC